MRSTVIPEPERLQEAGVNTLSSLLPFTYTISQFRNRTFEERGLVAHYKPMAGPAATSRVPDDSYLSITYPFTSNDTLRQQYQRFRSPFLRVGLLIEDMDSFAADVATRHLAGLPPGVTVVTAAVDRVALTMARPQQQQQQQQGQPEDAGAAADPGSNGCDAEASAAAAEQPAAAASCSPQQQQQLPPGWGPQQQQQQQQQLEKSVKAASIRDMLGAPDAPASIYNDLRMVGQVVWAGRSSMEVLVELQAAPPLTDTPASAASATVSSDSCDSGSKRCWAPRAVAHFVMVVRPTGEGQQPGAGSSWVVPQVLPQNPQEQQHFDTAVARAAAHRAKRKSKQLLSGIQPAGDEIKMLYELAERQLQRQIKKQEERETQSAWRARMLTSLPSSLGGASAAAAAAAASEDVDCPVPIASTAQSHLAIMHVQDRNNADNIFGGHLLRLASELAYSTAVLHAGRHCEAVALGDVTFKEPVPIGCVLAFRAKVVHTSGSLLRVSVVATKHQQLLERPSELHASVTNDFMFVFAAVGCHPLQPVEPESLREAVQFILANRQAAADGYVAPELLLREGMEHVLVG